MLMIVVTDTPLYPGTHSNDDNDGHLFRGRIHPPDVWAWSALSSVPRASDHLTTHRCFVSRAHLLVQACLALGTKLRERSDVESVVGILSLLSVGTCEPPVVISSSPAL